MRNIDEIRLYPKDLADALIKATGAGEDQEQLLINAIFDIREKALKGSESDKVLYNILAEVK